MASPPVTDVMLDAPTTTDRGSRSSRDVVSLLSLFAVVQIILPSRYVIGPLGGAGAPARLLGLGIGLWWFIEWLGSPWPSSQVRQALRVTALVHLAVVWVSYLIAGLRPTSPDEQLSSDRSILNIVAWIGLLMAAMDHIDSRERLETLLRRVAFLGAAEAAFGILQSLTGQTFVQYLHVPGLVDTGVDEGMLNRGGFIRPAGTAVHPIEYGVTISMILPIALHFAVADRHRGLLARWLPVGVIALALLLSISRSALICTGVVLVVLLSAWPPTLRRMVYLAAPTLVGGLVVVLPGFLSTIVSMFTGIGTDTSAASRTDSYALAWSFIAQNPVWGRGTGTFLPRYRILDNQYLGSLIEIGFVGVISLIVLFLTGAATGLRLSRRAPSADHEPEPLSRLGPALAACIAGGSISFAFFDAFSFPMIPSTLFLALGCVGALRRLEEEQDPRPTDEVPA